MFRSQSIVLGVLFVSTTQLFGQQPSRTLPTECPDLVGVWDFNCETDIGAGVRGRVRIERATNRFIFNYRNNIREEYRLNHLVDHGDSNPALTTAKQSMATCIDPQRLDIFESSMAFAFEQGSFQNVLEKTTYRRTGENLTSTTISLTDLQSFFEGDTRRIRYRKTCEFVPATED